MRPLHEHGIIERSHELVPSLWVQMSDNDINDPVRFRVRPPAVGQLDCLAIRLRCDRTECFDGELISSGCLDWHQLHPAVLDVLMHLGEREYFLAARNDCDRSCDWVWILR